MISDDLDKIQARLHDDGTLWSRVELLRWFNDGIRQLLAKSLTTKRYRLLDVPPRTAYAGTQEWEDRHGKGTFRRFTRPSGTGYYQTTFEWEVESREGIAPTDSGDCITHLWERSQSNDIDQHFRFTLPKGHDRIHRVAWDDIRLSGASTRQLDLLETKWWREGGRPMWWLEGVGRDQTFEVFEVVTDYNQQYVHLNDLDGGIPRGITGRTYTTQSVIFKNDYAYTGNGDLGFLTGLGFRVASSSINAATGETSTDEVTFLDSNAAGTDLNAISYWWEAELIPEDYTTFAVGIGRYWTSPDRQYTLAAYEGPYGGIRNFASSSDSVSVLESIVPTRDLTSDEDVQILHSRLLKYVRYYTMARAYTKEGEGKRIDLAQHWDQRFEMGVNFLRRLTNIAKRDKVWARDDFEAHDDIPPRVRLPSTFERYW